MSDLDAEIAVFWDKPMAYNPLVHLPPFLRGRQASLQRKAALTVLALDAASLMPGAAVPVQEDAGVHLALVVICLRALALVHQGHHWHTSGPTYYADHLLFERLYNALGPEIDAVAERAVGSSPIINLFDPLVQAGLISDMVAKMAPGGFNNPGGFVAQSLGAEQYLLDTLQYARERLTDRAWLTPGTDNLLAGIADKHETHVYLLRQRAQLAPIQPQDTHDSIR